MLKVGSCNTAVIPPIWNEGQQGERFSSHHFPQHWREWYRDAKSRGIRSAKETFRAARKGISMQFHSAPTQSRKPTVSRASGATLDMLNRVNDDFLRRNIVRIVPESELSAERKLHAQSPKMIFLDGLPFKSPADLRPFYSTFFTVDKGPDRLARGCIALGSKKDKRPIYLNDFMVDKPFLMDSIKQLCQMLQPQDFLATADLTEAYCTCHVAQRQRKLFRYRCLDHGQSVITIFLK